jgi:hypothetical protein
MTTLILRVHYEQMAAAFRMPVHVVTHGPCRDGRAAAVMFQYAQGAASMTEVDHRRDPVPIAPHATTLFLDTIPTAEELDTAAATPGCLIVVADHHEYNLPALRAMLNKCAAVLYGEGSASAVVLVLALLTLVHGAETVNKLGFVMEAIQEIAEADTSPNASPFAAHVFGMDGGDLLLGLTNRSKYEEYTAAGEAKIVKLKAEAEMVPMASGSVAGLKYSLCEAAPMLIKYLPVTADALFIRLGPDTYSVRAGPGRTVNDILLAVQTEDPKATGGGHAAAGRIKTTCPL